MKMKKLISVVVTVAMLFTLAVIPVSAEKGNKVTLIVEVDGNPLLQRENAVTLGATEFMETAEAEVAEVELLSTQATIKSDIKRKIRTVDTNKGFTYTSVFNGFSIETYESDIEKIKAIDGVKNVYLSHSYEIPDESSNSDVEKDIGALMMNAQYMYDNGYDGRGQAVAVIDEEFDVRHEFFSSDIVSPRFSKNYIKDFLENNSLNIDVSANQVYVSEKIPFAYDYAEGDADTYLAIGSHGTHVAGTIAGKNGNYHGYHFSGVAPEAQLILAKVGDDQRVLNDDKILAAFDDISKMDVSAINFSAGGTQVDSPYYEEMMERIRNAGIIVMCAGGNFDRAQTTTDEPDYAYPSSPALYDDVVSVASIDANEAWFAEQKMFLGNKDTVTYQADDKTGFFEKFSSEPYEYVLFDTVEDVQEKDAKNKILICTEEILSTAGAQVLFGKEPAGMIVLLNADVDGEGIVSNNLPIIFMRSSVKEQFYNSEVKTLQTVNDIEYKKEKNNSVMSYFTSWGTTTFLKLKPDITAPGGTILSSIPDDKYENKSGTSMAAPHMTGAAALMNGFMADKYPLVSGVDKVDLMQQLLMCSAQIVFQDEEKTLPESPRRQGAGLVDLNAAMKVPVILKSDAGKSKLSLGDMLGSNIELKFTAENLTNQDIIYDNPELYVFTDNYETQDGVNYITDSVPLSFSSNAENQSYTIPANSSREITITLNIDENQLAKNLEIFSNGFFIDGYIVFRSTDGVTPKTSMPFTGFYGDWTSFGCLDPSYFESDGGIGGLMGNDNNGNSSNLGVNQILNNLIDSGKASTEDYVLNEYESEDYVGYSPNDDNVFDNISISLYLTRSLTDTEVVVHDNKGNVVYEDKIPYGFSRVTGDGILNFDGPKYLPDGDYTLTASGKLAFNSDRSYRGEKTFKFYVDTVPPEISKPKIYEEDGRIYATFSVSDNRYLMGAQAFDGDNEVAVTPIKALKETDVLLDVTDADLQNLRFVVTDYAYNKTEFTIGNVSVNLIGNPIFNGNAMSFIINIMNTDADVDADIIAAIYSSDDTVIDVEVQHQMLISGQSIMKSFDFDNAYDYKYAKVFIWSHDNMNPLTEALKIE